MNPELLVAHFNRISDAPDSIPRLRRFVLDLAVRGKLAEQNPNDEPASTLLTRIQTKKAEITQNDGVRKEKPLPLLAEDDLPFCIPSNWRWSQLAEIGFINPRNIASDEIPSSFVPMTLISSEYGVANTHEVRPWGEIKSGFTHFAEGDVALAKITPCFENGKSTIFRGLTGGIGSGTTELHVVRPVIVSAEYILIFLKCPHFIESGTFRMTGTAGQKRVPTAYFSHSPFPLPPLAEQYRIVAKVAELMALCERLDSARGERDRRRDRLTAASNYHLNNATREVLRKHATFYLAHLPSLTTRPEQVKQFRQTILNLAVRGQLVPQDPDDEPAAKLLNRIQEEKANLAKNGKISRLDSIPQLPDSAFLSRLPSGWVSSTLKSLCTSVTDGDHLPPPKVDRGIPFLVIGNVRGQTLNFVGCRHVSEQYYNALDAIRRPQANDILYTLVGSYGIPVWLKDDRQFCVQRHIGILRPSRMINARFLSRILESKWVFDQATACATGIAQKTVPLAGLRGILIPLPPFPEQQRIVAKVDELMAVCDRLEAQLTTTQNKKRSLLEAVFHLALNDDAELEIRPRLVASES